MRIKIEGVCMAYDEATVEEAATNVAKRFDLLVELTGEGGPGGPIVNFIGTPKAIYTALTTAGEDGGWGCGDPEEDAEVAYLYLRDAKPIFG